MSKIKFVTLSIPLHQIIHALEEAAPLSLQESYDNAGLITGHMHQSIEKVLLTLDCTEAVVDEAIEVGAQLIIAHHPIVFSGLKKLNGNTYVERTIIKAIKNDIAIYAAHTNIDNVLHGVNNKIADKLGLKERGRNILKPMQNQLCKLHTYITSKHAEELRNALFQAGAGKIGLYDECSFNIIGEGTFKGNENSNPKVGKPMIREHAQETKIEIIFPVWKKNDVLKALREGHYYEEIAYEIYPTLNVNQETGSGLIGEFENAMDEKSFLSLLKDTFKTPLVRHTAFTGKPIRRVAVCGGAGIFLLNDAIRQHADAFITADVKYHQFFDAEGKTLLCDVGHFESEQFTSEIFLEIVRKKFPTFAALFSKTSTNPVNYY